MVEYLATAIASEEMLTTLLKPGQRPQRWQVLTFH